MSQRIADASAKVAPSFYPPPRMTDNDLFGLSRTMTGLSGEAVQHSNVLKSFSSPSNRLLQCMGLLMMWWTVPAPGNEVP